jgi:hypothetical protein
MHPLEGVSEITRIELAPIDELTDEAAPNKLVAPLPAIWMDA